MKYFAIPNEIHHLIQRYESAGFEAYVVGGAIRNLLLDREVNDWDLCTNATPEESHLLFSDYHIIDSGIAHGTITILIANQAVEVTRFRVDGSYSDKRRPDTIFYTSSIEEDLARRDFTINAMAYAPRTGLIDPYGGLNDLHSALIRTVGSPPARFGEDALRILRALRFASCLTFEIESDTATQIKEMRALLEHVSVERIHSEFERLICGPYAAKILSEYHSVVFQLFPELEAMFEFDQHNPHHHLDVWQHSLLALQNSVPEPRLRWALLMHDSAKPRSFTRDEKGIGHFYGHAKQSAEIAAEILHRYKFSNEDANFITELIRLHNDRIPDSPKTAKRLLNKTGAELYLALLDHHYADRSAQNPAFLYRLAEIEPARALALELIQSESCFNLSGLAVNGHDLIDLGLKGAQVGQALRYLLDLVIDEACPNQKSDLINSLKSQLTLFT